VARIRGRRARRGAGRGRVARLRVGAADPSLTPVAGMAAVTELVERLDVVAAVDAAVGPIKVRDRGHGAGQLLVGIAAAQLAGADFLVGLDRQRADAAGQALSPVPGLCSSTASGLARRVTAGQWAAVETGVAASTARMLGMLPAKRAAALAAVVTVDLDTTDVEVYGSKKRGVAYNYQGQRVGRPHVATWAETGTVLAADLLAGDVDPRAGAPGLLRRALGALPPVARAGRVRMRADAATSPDIWPAPRTRRTSGSRSAANASLHCGGGCSTASPRPTGPTPWTCPARRLAGACHDNRVSDG
jgi:hypothetical protein